jgi:uncharacterized glyoxalase superfamily protein PhnB
MARGVPDGWHSVTPRLVVDDPPKLVEFLRRAFGAIGDLHTDRPSEMRIGDSIVMVSGTEAREPMPTLLYLYVEHTDVTYRKALEAGATSLEEPTDMPYGDRRATVKDPCANVWQIATTAL